MKKLVILFVCLLASALTAGEILVHTNQVEAVAASSARRGFVIINTSTNANLFIAIGATNEIARLTPGGSWTECGPVPQGSILLRGSLTNTSCYAGDW